MGLDKLSSPVVAFGVVVAAAVVDAAVAAGVTVVVADG